MILYSRNNILAGKKIESVETAQIEAADKEDKSAAGGKLTEDEVKAFNKWIKSVLDDKVSLVRVCAL